MVAHSPFSTVYSMPILPQPDERDRHIQPITGDEDSPDNDQAGDEELATMSVVEDDDGSALVTFEDELDLEPTEFDTNLAELLDEDVLYNLGKDLIEHIERDKKARERRDEQYEEGLRRTGLGNEAPGGAQFNGASKAVHPMLAEACVDFASRAIKELFPPTGPVRTAILGKEDNAKIDVATRKASYLNWQMTNKIREYRSELEQMLTQLPMGGSQYQKFWYDDNFKRVRTEFVPIDDIFLPYATTDFYTSIRVTHVQHLTKQEFDRRVRSGLYRDVVETYIAPEGPELTASAVANNKIEGRDVDAYNEDGIRDVYEIYVYNEFEQDDVTQGDSAPYIVTVDGYTEAVLSVYRNWESTDSTFQKRDWIVEWKFIPWRGAYAIGLPHLIGSLSGAATGALRALLDAAHISNSQSLVKLRGGKVSGQNIEIEPTQVAEIDGPAGVDDIRKIMMALPYNPPSPVLFQLLGWLSEAGKGVIRTAEESMKNIGDRTPVGTTMAMVEQGAHTYSAIHARLHYSQAKSLEILCRLNKTYMEDEETIEELGSLTISREEFSSSRDVIPVTDPEIFSESQRYAQMQGAAQVRQMFPEQRWNDNSLARSMLHRLRLQNVDEILPEPPKPKNMNPAAENVAAMHGQPVLALPKQNHMAHIMTHLDFCTNPIIANPIMGQKLMPQMLRHITEHIGFYYADLINQLTMFEEVVAQMPTKQLEMRIAQANMQAMQQMQQDMAPVMQKLQMIQQMAQQFAPPPPMDPAVKATFDVGMAEVNRKKERDGAELDVLRQEKLQLIPQVEKAKHDLDAMKNLRDNMQKHQTELAKNQGDNQTNQWIAALKMQQEQLMNLVQTKIDQSEAELNRQQDFRLAQQQTQNQDPTSSL